VSFVGLFEGVKPANYDNPLDMTININVMPQINPFLTTTI
jgi:hypothetical protein